MRMTEIAPDLWYSSGVHSDGSWSAGGPVKRWQKFRSVIHDYGVRWYSFPRLFWNMVIKGMCT